MLYGMVHGRPPPNWNFEGIIFGPFHTFEEPISTYPPNFVKISWSGGGRYTPLPQKKIRNGFSCGGILLPVPILTSVIFRGPSCVMIIQNLNKNRSTRGWFVCDSTCSIPTFKPTLPTAQRHSADGTTTQCCHAPAWRRLSSVIVPRLTLSSPHL